VTKRHQQYRHAQKAAATPACACVENISKPACTCVENISNTGLRMRRKQYRLAHVQKAIPACACVESISNIGVRMRRKHQQYAHA
jgi:hypothetical protein